MAKAEPNESAPINIPDLIWRILFAKGITSAEEINSFLNPSLKDLAHPSKLKGMDTAVERLLKAYWDQETLAIYGDFDLDGSSGLALLSEGLRMLGFQNIETYQPSRLEEGYGFHASAVEKLKLKGVSLIITVDVGITAVEAVEKATELGVNVIITDHHQAKEKLPQALAIVNPNQPACESALGHLAGTGVAYYLLLALHSEMKAKDLIEKPVNLKTLLDFFVIGTLTDMVPLLKENRILVKHGLEVLSKTKRPGLSSLLKELKLYGRKLTGQDVAIRFAPKLNALTRLESSIKPVDLYLAMDHEQAELFTQETMQTNAKRVSLQQEAEKIAIDSLIQSSPKGFVWTFSDQFHKGVIGLIATKLSQKFGVPAFVGSIQGDKIAGSARSGDRGSVLEALEAGSQTLLQFGGHHAAAGFELESKQAGDFETLLLKHFEKVSSNDDVSASSVLEYDTHARLDEIHTGFMKWYEVLEPFGAGFEAPLLYSSKVRIRGIRTLKGGHLKLSLSQSSFDHRHEAIWFSPPTQHPALKAGLSVDGVINIVYEVQWNYFAGKKSVQLLIKDLMISN